MDRAIYSCIAVFLGLTSCYQLCIRDFFTFYSIAFSDASSFFMVRLPFPGEVSGHVPSSCPRLAARTEFRQECHLSRLARNDQYTPPVSKWVGAVRERSLPPRDWSTPGYWNRAFSWPSVMIARALQRFRDKHECHLLITER